MSTNTNSISYSINIDGAAPNNQNGSTQGGIGMAVYDEKIKMSMREWLL